MADIVISGNTSGAVTLRAPDVSGTTLLTLPTTSGTIVTTAGATSLTTSGNLTFTGTGNRITGDFSNATVANRVAFQTSMTNGSTSLSVIPNGTGPNSGIFLESDSSVTNSSRMVVQIVGGSDARISSATLGSGTALPLTMYTGGSERLRIDTSGRVGVGTSSPQGLLDLGVGSQTYNPTVTGSLRLAQSGSPTTTNNGGIEFIASGFASGYGYRIATCDEGGGSTPLTFLYRLNSASWTEGMRFTVGGDLLVGTTTGGVNQKSKFKTTTTNAWPLTLESDNRGLLVIETNPSGGIVAYFVVNSVTEVGSIQTNSTSTSYVTSSDYRLKENILPMTGALDKVAQLKPVTYNWKVNGSIGQGFIAHELQEVIPDAVVGEKDGEKMQGVDTSFLVATLTAAIQEQQTMIHELKARIDVLEGAK